ncbi:unnamed protein product [Brassica oleracea var. botrytis]
MSLIFGNDGKSYQIRKSVIRDFEPQQTGIEFLSSPNHAQTIRASVRTIPIFTGDKPTKPRASAIDVKETLNDDMCVLISSFNYQCLHFGLNHEFAVTARALVICAGVQENGKLPTENEPKIGLSLQNVRTVKVEGFPSLFRYIRWCSYNVQWLSSSQFLSSTMAIVMIIEEEEK